MLIDFKLATTFCLFACFTLLGLFQSVQAQNDKTRIVDRFIADQAKQERAVEYSKARKLMQSDLDGDGKEDLVVLYTLESFSGTNLYLQYLAVFTNHSNKLVLSTRISVGGKNQRILELKSVSNGQINFDTREYLPQDASCCPSGSGRARFTFRKGKLKEIKRRVAADKT